MDSPLEGVTVVDFGQLIAAPAATAVLADLGADVVKVEPKGGEVSRNIGSLGLGFLLAHNRGKRSIAIDLRHPQGRAIAETLVKGADVVTHNMRPGAMDKLGLGSSRVLALNPRVIYASVTGFDAKAPSARRACVDIVAQAESGIMSLTGEPDGRPLRAGYPAADGSAAQMLAQAILAALFRRERTGVGDVVTVSLMDAAIKIQATMFSEYFLTDEVPKRLGNGQPSAAPAADSVRTADGNIVLSAYTKAHWEKLCRLLDCEDMLEDPRFLDNPSRAQHRSELLSRIEAVLISKTTAECVELLSSNGLLVGSVLTYPEVVASPDIQASGIFRVGTDEDGQPQPYVGVPYRFTSWAPDVSDPVPRAGQHTVQVLAELGYGSADVAQLLNSGVVEQFEGDAELLAVEEGQATGRNGWSATAEDHAGRTQGGRG